MCSSNEKPEKNRLLYDELYWELCVLQACAFGAYFVSREQYCSRFEDMSVALMREFDRVKEMYESLDLEQSAKASK